MRIRSRRWRGRDSGLSDCFWTWTLPGNPQGLWGRIAAVRLYLPIGWAPGSRPGTSLGLAISYPGFHAPRSVSFPSSSYSPNFECLEWCALSYPAPHVPICVFAAAPQGVPRWLCAPSAPEHLGDAPVTRVWLMLVGRLPHAGKESCFRGRSPRRCTRHFHCCWGCGIA